MKRFFHLIIVAIVAAIVSGACISCQKEDTSKSEIVVEKMTIGIKCYDVFEEYTVIRLDPTADRPFECYYANDCIKNTLAIAEVEFKSQSTPGVIVEDYPELDASNARLSDCVKIGDGRWKAIIYVTVDCEAKVTIKDGKSTLTFGIFAAGKAGQSLFSGNNESISNAEFESAAESLGVSVAAIKAVEEVVTGKKRAFISDGRPVIMFEGHIFWQELKHKGIDPYALVRGNEDILYDKWTKTYYQEGALEYGRLERAKAIDETAACRSTKWGAFNILGSDYSKCGCGSITDFIDKMNQSRAAQLFLFASYIKSTDGARYLQKLDWTGFAQYYFGSDYLQNMYDVKLAKAYYKYAQ